MAAPFGSDAVDLALQQAHLLAMRKRHREARALLLQLQAANPGRVDILESLQEVPDPDAARAPRRPRLIPASTIMVGLFALFLAGCHGIPALRAYLAYGWNATVPTRSRFGVPGHAPVALCMAQAGFFACLSLVCWVSVGWRALRGFR